MRLGDAYLLLPEELSACLLSYNIKNISFPQEIYMSEFDGSNMQLFHIFTFLHRHFL